MSIFEKLNEAICYSEDLETCGKKLVEFADEALKQKNKATIAKRFNEQLITFAMPAYVFDFSKKAYTIFEDREAVSLYLITNLTRQLTPVKLLNAIKSLGNDMSSIYTSPVGPRISKGKIEEIMSYLDMEYDFSRRTFNDEKAMFLLFNNSHIKLNSECLILASKGGQINQHLFLYHMSTNDSETPFPESVFLHELGHALHTRFAGSTDIIHSEILTFLEGLCFPTIKSLDLHDQREVLADILSVGMMYNSPFAKYDPFPQIRVEDKKIFNMMFRKMLDML
jgi:hypothetical protein